MPHDTGFDRQGLIAQIKLHCEAGDTGTLFLLTEQSATVKLVLSEGDIVALSYQSIRGEDAIEPISQLQHCKLRYYAGVKLLPVNNKLPDTETILDLLQGGTTQEATITTQIIAPATPPSTQSKTIRDTLENVLTILTEEATEFLGPFAAVLCKKYLESASNPPSLEAINLALHQLAGDIRDETKSSQLERKVLQRIRL